MVTFSMTLTYPLPGFQGRGIFEVQYQTASELILEWGVEEARPEGPRAGDGVLGEGIASPSPAARGFAGAL